MARRRRLKRSRKLLFALLALAAFLGLLELSLRLSGYRIDSGGVIRIDRLFFNEMTRHDSQWDEYITLGAKVYPLEPGNYNIDRELTPKPAGAWRVACLGDSSTIGDRVRPDQPYPQVLGRLLAACYPQQPIEVWNLGRHGYSSYQGRLLLDQVWERLQPDVLVFYFGANDAAVAPLRADRAWSDLPRWALWLHRQAYLHSALYRVLRNINIGYLRHRAKTAFSDAPVAQEVRMRVSREDFWENRDALRDHVSRDGGILLQISSAGVTGDRVVPNQYFDKWQPGPDDLDLAALFAPEYAAGRNPFADEVHPNAAGHRLLARALLEKLAAHWGPPACDPEALLAAEAARD